MTVKGNEEDETFALLIDSEVSSSYVDRFADQ